VPQDDISYVILSLNANDPVVWITGENNAAMDDGLKILTWKNTKYAGSRLRLRMTDAESTKYAGSSCALYDRLRWRLENRYAREVRKKA